MTEATSQEFTVERAYLIPVYQHITVMAASAEEAARKVVASDDWESQREDYESARATYVDGIWPGPAAHAGPSLDVPADLHNPEGVALDLLRHVLAVINSTDSDHADFLDSGADSIDLLWQIEQPLKALLGEQQRPIVEAARAMERGPDQATMRLVIAAESMLTAARENIPTGFATEIAELGKALEPWTDSRKPCDVCGAPAEAGTCCNSCLPGVVGQDLAADVRAFEAEGDLAQAADLRSMMENPPLRTSESEKRLARIRRDAQNIEHRMSDESANSSAGEAEDLSAIDSRVDLLLRNVSNLAGLVDALGSIVEDRA